jgi:hypothetical protein
MPRPHEAGPLHVPSLTARERDAVMPDLRVWVDRLVDRFALDTRVIPPCWEQHNGMVEALSALRDHERGSYDADADPRSAVDWLRALREVRALLTELAALTQCSVHQHRDPTLRPPSHPAGERQDTTRSRRPQSSRAVPAGEHDAGGSAFEPVLTPPGA